LRHLVLLEWPLIQIGAVGAVGAVGASRVIRHKGLHAEPEYQLLCGYCTCVENSTSTSNQRVDERTIRDKEGKSVQVQNIGNEPGQNEARQGTEIQGQPRIQHVPTQYVGRKNKEVPCEPKVPKTQQRILALRKFELWIARDLLDIAFGPT